MFLYIDLAVVSKDIFIPSKEHVLVLFYHSVHTLWCLLCWFDDLMAENAKLNFWNKIICLPLFPFNSFPQPNSVAQWRNMCKRYLKINVEFKSSSSLIWIFTHVSVSIFWKCLCAIALKYYICVMPGFVCAFSQTMKDCMKYKTKTKKTCFKGENESMQSMQKNLGCEDGMCRWVYFRL